MKLWDKVFKKEVNFDHLSRILSDSGNRESLMGVKREPQLTPEQHTNMLNRDINAIIHHSSDGDYAIWAKEVWSEYVNMSTKLMDPATDQRTVEFLRGCMSMSINLLTLSYRVRNMREQNETKKEKNKENVLRVS